MNGQALATAGAYAYVQQEPGQEKRRPIQAEARIQPRPISREDRLWRPTPGIDPELRVFWGQIDDSTSLSDSAIENANNHSVVLRVAFGSFSALFVGDIEEDAQEDLVARSSAELDVDLYKVGHHGSINGTTQSLLDAMTPAAAVFGVGDPQREGRFSANAFGHPRVEIVTMLERAISRRRSTPVDVLVGLRGRGRGRPSLSNFEEHTIRDALYATAWDGTIVVTAESDGRFSVRRAGGG